MTYGYHGKILRIDLSKRKIEIEYPDEVFYRRYWGSSCQGLYYLLKELPVGIDPLGPQNILIFTPGIATGIPASGFCRFTVQAKSPLTGGLAESQSSGYFSPELKFAGWDGIIFKGKSEKPVYLWIKDDRVEIKDASHLWGMDIGFTEDNIREELNEPRARMAVIGPAGENLVRFACIINNKRHAAGRNGLGAVMGSKNLKAVVVRGTKKVNIFDKETVIELAKKFKNNYKNNPDDKNLSLFGTGYYTLLNNESGTLPVRNFKTGHDERADAISGETITEEILKKHAPCWGCAVGCKPVIDSSKARDIDPEFGGPEYETIASLGSNLDIFDADAVCRAHVLCNKYGQDTISTGGTIAWAMECYELGLITKNDTGGIEVKFGDSKIMLQLIEDIAFKRGFGKLLSEGSARASEKIGRGSERYALHSKKQEIPMHDPRVKGMLALSYSISSVGADHTRVEHDCDFDFHAPKVYRDQAKCLGILEPLESVVLDEKKVRWHYYLKQHFSLLDALPVCMLTVAPVRTHTMSDLMKLLSAATGWEVTLWEMMKLGEKRFVMARCFNTREGFTSKDDTLPERMFEPIETGPTRGNKLDKANFLKMKKLYYEICNWDTETGIPRRAKLIELELDWLNPELDKIRESLK